MSIAETVVAELKDTIAALSKDPCTCDAVREGANVTYTYRMIGELCPTCQAIVDAEERIWNIENGLVDPASLVPAEIPVRDEVDWSGLPEDDRPPF